MTSVAEPHRAVFLHGPRDLRLAATKPPAAPVAGDVQVRIASVGICGSDLHTYLDGRIGDTSVTEPLILGHEFAGRVTAAAPDARGGQGEALRVGDRVAVEPARPCGRCEVCRLGHPNLCPDHTFCGVAPTHGALQTAMNVPTDTCFKVPDGIGDDAAALLEPLGVAIHATDLAHLKPGHAVLIVGAGPIGLLCARLAVLAGASRVWVSDRHAWRLDLAERFGAIPLLLDDGDPAARIHDATESRGVDVALEAAWSDDDAVAQAVDALRPGGRLVVVGIAGDDRLTFRHSAVRRRGLTIAMCRRMKHTYPRAIPLAATGRVDLEMLVSHRFDLADTAEAFRIVAGYEQQIVRALVHP